MRIRVLFFGVLRDFTGQRECEVDLAEGVTAAGLFDHFAAQFPALEAARRSVTVARNQEFADPSVRLADGDEVALLPPVSGGSGRWIHEITTAESGNFYGLTREPIDAAAGRLLRVGFMMLSLMRATSNWNHGFAKSVC